MKKIHLSYQTSNWKHTRDHTKITLNITDILHIITQRCLCTSI